MLVGAVTPLFALSAAAVAVGPEATYGAGARNAIIVVESWALSLAAVQSVKFFFARKRPFDRYGHGTLEGTYDVNDRDSHISFPSGHTAFATSLGVSAAMTATLENSSATPWLWGAAAALSAGTASLRMMAEKHYFTDVFGGAVIGAGVGVLVPWLHCKGGLLARGTVAVSVGPQGPMVVLASEW